MLEKVKNNKGFTLIELLVVVAIVGLLGSVVTNAVGRSRVGARDARRVQDVRQIKTGIDLYFTNGGGYPPAVLFVPNTQIYCNATPILHVPADPSSPAYNYIYTPAADNVPGCGRNDLALSYTLQFTLEKDGVTYTMDEDGQFSPGLPEL